jgi:hypothetical protein
MATRAATKDIRGVSPFVLALRQALQDKSGRPLARFAIDDLEVEIRESADSVWALIRRPGLGGVALRAAYLAGPFECTLAEREPGEAARLRVTSVLGEHILSFQTRGEGLEFIRATMRFTPAVPMLIPFLPRDLYPIDAKDDPLRARGTIEAGQRGLNAGVLYFRIEEPAFGNVLYFQNLTAMNDYYRATKTKPDGAVGGDWPELGWLLPTPRQFGTPPTGALEAGVEVTMSDAILVFRHEAPSMSASLRAVPPDARCRL